MQADPPLQQIDSRDQVEPGSAAYYLWMIYEVGRANYKATGTLADPSRAAK